jgi:hypothetical protein
MDILPHHCNTCSDNRCIVNITNNWNEIWNKLPKPDDIPTAPYSTYKDKGWVNLADWLGTRVFATRYREYRSYSKARAFVQKEWRKYCKGELPYKPPKPDDIPAVPARTYKNKGWVSWGDCLGTGAIATFYLRYRLYPNARAFVHALGIRTVQEWREYCKGKLSGKPTKPYDIPAHPPRTYKNKGWVSWLDWFGKRKRQ